MEAFGVALGILRTGAIFLLVLTVLVAVHELGHYWFARMAGMKVDAFAIMMGGLRKSRLEGHLHRPLIPGIWLWLLGAASVAATLVGAVENAVPLSVGGLTILGVVLPVWVATRVGALYHMPLATTIKWLSMGWGGGLAILAVASRMQGVTAVNILAMMVSGAMISLLVIYYFPMLHKSEDSEPGLGKIEVEGQPLSVQFRPLFSHKSKSGTEFSMLLLPLGGFAAIHGMHPKEDGSEVRIPEGFYSKSPLKRLMVLFAGPLFSIAFGVVLIFFFLLGSGVASDKPIVGSVQANSAAKVAGLRAGDKLIRIGERPIQKWMDVLDSVRGQEGKTMPVTLERGGKTLTIPVTPRLSDQPVPTLDAKGQPTGKNERRALLGIAPSSEPMPPIRAAKLAVATPYLLVSMIAHVISAGRPQDALGGPVSMVQATSEEADRGLSGILYLAASLSISLGIMNLLPFPPLDGGQMVVAFVEMLRGGKRLSMQVQHAMSTLGMFLVLALVVGAMTIDIGRFTGPGKNKPTAATKSAP